MNASLGLPARKARKLGLTALIDVVFILLMFFMLTSSFIQWRSLDLVSRATATANTSDQHQPALLVAHEDGALTARLGSQHHYWPDLDQALLPHPDGLASAWDQYRQNHPESAPANLTLLPEANVSVQSLVTLMARTDTAGVGPVNLGDALEQEIPHAQ